jgi:hypothetical protein
MSYQIIPSIYKTQDKVELFLPRRTLRKRWTPFGTLSERDLVQGALAPWGNSDHAKPFGYFMRDRIVLYIRNYKILTESESILFSQIDQVIVRSEIQIEVIYWKSKFEKIAKKIETENLVIAELLDRVKLQNQNTIVQYKFENENLLNGGYWLMAILSVIGILIYLTILGF